MFRIHYWIVALFGLFVLPPSISASILNWDGKVGAGGFNAIRVNDTLYLDLTVTRGLSYTDALAETEPGMRFDEWRVASASEADRIRSVAGLLPGQHLSNRQKVIDLMAIWGGPFSGTSFSGGVSFIVADQDRGFAARQGGGIRYDTSFGWWNGIGSGGLPDDVGSINYGVVMIRSLPPAPPPSVVPEPCSIIVWSFLGVLTAVCRWGRKPAKKKDCSHFVVES